MRTSHKTAAFIVLPSIAMLTASCAQSPTAMPGTNGTDGSAPAIEIKDEDDPFGGDPDVGGGIGGEPPASSVGSTPTEEEEDVASSRRLLVCVALGGAPPAARVVFCNTLRDRRAKGRCMEKTQASAIKWINWCHFEFGD